MINRTAELLHQARSKGLMGQMARAGIGSLAIKFLATLLGFIVAILLARVLGPEDYGIYAYVLSLVSLLAIPAQFGLPKLVVRETAKAHVDEQWGLMRGVWRWATVMVGTFSAGIGFIAFITAVFFANHFSQLQFKTFLWGLVLLPLVALGRLRGAALQGLRRVLLGQLPDSVLRPGLLILLIFAIVSWSAGEHLNASTVMAFHSLAALMAFIFGSWSLLLSQPSSIKLNPLRMYKTRAWLSAIWPLAIAGSMQQINMRADIIMLGIFGTAEDVGIYRVAVQVATLVILGLQVIATVIPPYFARMHAKGDRKRLQELVTRSARTTLLLALPVTVILLFWSERVIRLLFGLQYARACVPLTILAIGQLINSAFGAVGPLMNMTGHERDTAQAIAIAAAVNITLNLVLIPILGITGAAMATAVTLATWNILLWRVARLRLGIETMAIRISKFTPSLQENS